MLAVWVYHCKHPGGPELSSSPQLYCVTRMVQDLVVVVDGLILKSASWQSDPFESTITEIKGNFIQIAPMEHDFSVYQFLHTGNTALPL